MLEVTGARQLMVAILDDELRFFAKGVLLHIRKVTRVDEVLAAPVDPAQAAPGLRLEAARHPGSPVR